MQNEQNEKIERIDVYKYVDDSLELELTLFAGLFLLIRYINPYHLDFNFIHEVLTLNMSLDKWLNSLLHLMIYNT